MTKTRKSVFAVLIGCLGVMTYLPAMLAEEPSAASPDAKLPLNAVLVLTPEFCATKFKQGSVWTTGRETFAVGKMACTDLEPALKSAFANLTVVSAPPTSGDAQLVLVPKFADTHATTSSFAFANREMDVFLEWTAKDSAGKTIWLQTVQGSSKHHMGNVFTHGHNVNLIVRDSVKDVADQSVAKMEAAAELQKLAHGKAASAK